MERKSLKRPREEEEPLDVHARDVHARAVALKPKITIAPSLPAPTNPLTPAQIEHYRAEGWLVVDVLTPEQCRVLSLGFQDALQRALLGDEKYVLDLNHPKTYEIFTDAKLRERSLDNPNFVYKGGRKGARPNTRLPRVSKNCGMVNFYNLPLKERHITANKLIYEVYAQLLGTRRLMVNPERMSVKSPGSVHMKLHTDTHPFFPPKQDGFMRKPTQPFDLIQGFVCFHGSDDEKIDVGNLEVYPRFHHYWKLFERFYHPSYGVKKLPKGTFVPYWFDSKGLDLKDFNTFCKTYTAVQDGKAVPTLPYYTETQHIHHTLRIRVPTPFKSLKPRKIIVKAGQMVLWDCCLPHRSLRNKSTVPRMVAYTSLVPLMDGYQSHKDYVAHVASLGSKHSIYGQGSHRSNEDEIPLIDADPHYFSCMRDNVFYQQIMFGHYE